MNERNSIVLKSTTTPDKIVHSPSFNSINVFHVLMRTQTANNSHSNSSSRNNSSSNSIIVVVVVVAAAITIQTTPDLSRNRNTTKNMLHEIENCKKTITRLTLEKFDFFKRVVCFFLACRSSMGGLYMNMSVIVRCHTTQKEVILIDEVAVTAYVFPNE